MNRLRIATLADLEQAKEKGLKSMYPGITKITVGMATCGLATGAQRVFEAIVKEVEKQHLDIVIAKTGCFGYCQKEPLVDVLVPGKSKITYVQMNPDKATELVRTLAQDGIKKEWVAWKTLEEDYLIEDKKRKYFVDNLPEDLDEIPLYEEIPFFRKQQKIALRNCGLIDPENIDEYIAKGGYRSLYKILTGMSPEEVIDEISRSGLRGRGGAGFPTGTKWGFCRAAQGEPKYVICNADEGDPGAYMDRSVLEGDPHSVLEGMLIGAYAIGASEGYIYVRTEYPLAIEKLKTAIEQAEEHGLLGENIFNSGFNFRIKITQGAGAFVCGEETALIASIEGRNPEPVIRPPFPAQSGLWEKPTNINNVETWANVPAIIARGADWYSRIGTERSRGTKVFSLVGKINNSGLVEVPMGIPLREIIYDIGGGILEGKRFKATQTGGPSGGCIPSKLLDIPVDYEHLGEAGSIMGSGGMVVVDEDTCVVDLAKYFIDFTRDESCGRCNSCREGLDALFEILTRISNGEGEDGDLEFLEDLSNAIKDFSLCGLGQTAPNPVLSTIRHFRDEYEEHIKYKRCPAVVCKGIISSACQYTCPIHQDVPCYIGLIAQGQFEDAIEIIRKENPFPSICGRVCTHPCEDKCESGKTGKPIAVRALKRFAADYELSMKKDILPPYRITKEEKIAIVGSGPAGLTAAHYLSVMGYKVTVFEALPVAGGMLTVGIPDYRLPKEVLQREIDAIVKAGLDIRLNTRIGTDLTIDDLQKDGHKAIFIASGAHESAKLDVPDEDLKGVVHGVSLLRDMNLGKKVRIGSEVAVVGGGNVAIDSARSALRLGSKDVTIIYRRSRAEMPASEEEISQAEEEGIKIEYLLAPTKILGSNGNVAGVECIRMELGPPDESGRRRPIPIKGSEFNMECDTVIPAIGQFADLSFVLGNDNNIRSTDRRTISVDLETFETGQEGIFAGGDVVSGPATVVEAIATGKEVAKAIDSYLQGKKYKKEYKVITPAIHVEPIELSEEEIETLERPEMPRSPVAERTNNFQEVELGFTEELAIMEARRCLRCDLERGEQ